MPREISRLVLLVQPTTDLLGRCDASMQFFLMLNFTIAIIVESYEKAKAEVEEDESELSFFTDITYSLYSSGFRISLGAPPTRVIVKHISGLFNKHLSAEVLAHAIEPATLHLTSIQRNRMALHLLRYFTRFETLRPGNQQSAALTQDEKIVDKVACMLNQRVPTEYETMVAQHRLRRLSWRRQSSSSLSSNAVVESFVAPDGDQELAVKWRRGECRDDQQHERDVDANIERPVHGRPMERTVRRITRRRKLTSSPSAPALTQAAQFMEVSADLSEPSLGSHDFL